MNFLKTESTLPPSVLASVGVRAGADSVNCQYWSNGLVEPDKGGYDISIGISNNEEQECLLGFYGELAENGSLIICETYAKVNEETETLQFYGNPVDEWEPNEYGELISKKGSESLAETVYWHYIIDCFPIINTDTVLIPWIINMMVRDGFYYDFVKAGHLTKDFFLGMFNMYTCGFSNHIPNLISKGLLKDIHDLATEYETAEINKNVIFLANELKTRFTETGTGSIIKLAEKILDNHEINDVKNLIQFLDICDAHDFRWAVLANLDVRLNLFNNYMVKQVFTGEGFCKKFESQWTPTHAVRDFPVIYKDYLEMAGGNAEPWPENLDEAHRQVVEEFTRSKKESMDSSTEEKYIKAVSGKAYLNLEDSFNIGDSRYCFSVPMSPEALRANGKAMHHCVGGYVRGVANRTCRIIIIKKDEKPYMTMEIVKNKIVQCKRKCNELPSSAEDMEIINKYASSKSLTVVSF